VQGFVEFDCSAATAATRSVVLIDSVAVASPPVLLPESDPGILT